MTAATRSAPLTRANILIVDDNKVGLAARKAVLEELGHRITTVTAGDEALEHLKNSRFDLVITDCRMPKMDGLDLIKRIRAGNPAIPVILLSGYVDVLGLNEANTGADLVLSKDANEVAHLVRSVSRLLSRKTRKKPPSSHRPPLTRKRKTH